MYRNQVIILENKVIKKFSREKDFLTELKGRQIFSDRWNVPQLIGINNQKLTVEYERINASTLAEKIDALSLDKIKQYISKIESKGLEKEIELRDYSEALTILPPRFSDRVRIKPETVVHGDFRPYNILEGDTLIDFEFVHNGIVEEDLAKFYIETLSLNPRLAHEMHEYAKVRDYHTFLFHCLLIGCTQLETGFYSRNNISNFIMQVKEEIKRVM